jgi:hypothetical protein
MLGTLARLGVLAAALVVAAASSTNQGRSPQYPYNSPPPTTGMSPQRQMEPVYVCTEVHTQKTDGSFCFPSQERCDRERRDAEKDGARTTDCRPLAPVSCFQLGNDPNPSMEACAATPSDCDLLRLIDRDKNGQTGGPCQWRHGIAQGPGAPPPAAR